jgi:hypothetical protein
VRIAIILALAAVLAGCGGHKPDTYATGNTALLDRVPEYPGTASPKTTANGAGGIEFASRDWTLPAGARAESVVDWYVSRLQAARWRVIGKSFNTIRATRGKASLSVGVRGRTLEVIANSRGA